MPIRAVFFDFGGVILRTEYQSPRQGLAERFNMDYEEIEKVVLGLNLPDAPRWVRSPRRRTGSRFLNDSVNRPPK